MAGTRQAPRHNSTFHSASRSETQTGWLLTGLEWAMLAAGLALWVAAPTERAALGLGAGLVGGSWLARWVRTGRLTRATLLDLPLALFAVSLLLGLWAAPQMQTALPRLCLFVGGISLYYSLANSPHRTLPQVLRVVMVVAAGLGLYDLIPNLGWPELEHNLAAGALGALASLAAGLVIHDLKTWRKRRDLSAALAATSSALSLALIVLTIALSESRTTWVALAAGVGLATGWWLLRRLSSGWRLVVLGLCTVGGALLLTAAALRADLFVRSAAYLPGPPTTLSNRLQVFSQAWRLGQETPFTGGGLGAFPALYATYLLDLPVPMLAHAHNIYLNVLIEQGWLGLASLVLSLACAAWAGARKLVRSDHATAIDAPRVLLAAGWIGLAVIAIQGLGDGTLVATGAALVLFVPAGAVASLSATDTVPSYRAWLRPVGLAAVLGVLVLAGLSHRLQSIWLTNLAVVELSRVWLVDWPTAEWGLATQGTGIEAAEQRLTRAVALNPGNVIAHYRLGYLASQRHDYATAAEHLERAAAGDAGHRGINKVLGYVNVWLGNYAAAEKLLLRIPEARREMEVYAWWWSEQGRPDLASHAAQMQARLDP